MESGEDLLGFHWICFASTGSDPLPLDMLCFHRIWSVSAEALAFKLEATAIEMKRRLRRIKQDKEINGGWGDEAAAREEKQWLSRMDLTFFIYCQFILFYIKLFPIIFKLILIIFNYFQFIFTYFQFILFKF